MMRMLSYSRAANRFLELGPWSAACTSAAQERLSHNDTASTIDAKEVRKFAALSAEWWNPFGPFKALHALNVARVSFIRDAVVGHMRKSRSQAENKAEPLTTHSAQGALHAEAGSRDDSAFSKGARGLGPEAENSGALGLYPLQGLRIVDVGCGGGILAESLARLGAHVTGVDATAENIAVARAHAALDPLIQSRVRYESEQAEALVARGERFDVTISSEVIEHVKAPEQFCQTLADLTGEGGCIAITTINRTPASYMLAIVAAERVLGLAPAGTHDWRKFVTPEELHMMFKPTGFKLDQVAGMRMDPFGKWSLSSWTDVNYAAFLTRESH